MAANTPLHADDSANVSLPKPLTLKAAGQDYVASLYVFDGVGTEHLIARIRAPAHCVGACCGAC